VASYVGSVHCATTDQDSVIANVFILDSVLHGLISEDGTHQISLPLWILRKYDVMECILGEPTVHSHITLSKNGVHGLRVHIHIYMIVDSVKRNLTDGKVCKLTSYLLQTEMAGMLSPYDGVSLSNSCYRCGMAKQCLGMDDLTYVSTHVSGTTVIKGLLSKPFDHQLHSMNRMLEIEEEDVMWQRSDVHKLKITRELYYDKQSKQFGLYGEDGDNTAQVPLKNGCLCDKMGSGKTLTALMCMFSGSKIVKSCSDGLLRCPCNVVICPSHVCMQWKSEVIKHFGSSYKVSTLATKQDFCTLTYRDVLKSDMLLISWNIFANTMYRQQFNGLVGRTFPELLSSRVRLSKAAMQKDYDGFIANASIDLFAIHFKRIFVDEIHEINFGNKSHVRDAVLNLQADHMWCITATPFLNKNEYYHDNIIYPILTRGERYTNLCSTDLQSIAKTFVVSDPHAISLQVKLPEITEEMVEVHLSDIEKRMYDAHRDHESTNELLKFCCSPKIVNRFSQLITSCKDMKSVFKKMQKYYESVLARLETDVAAMDRQMSTFEVGHQVTGVATLTADILQESRDLLSGQRSTLQAEMDTCNSILSYAKQHVENYDSDTDCPLCLEVVEVPVVLPCAHIICRCCYNDLAHRNMRSCPVCRRSWSQTNVLTIGDVDSSNANLYSSLQDKFGSKIAQLKFEVSRLISEDRKIIVFSQYDSLLHEIGKCLGKMNIPVLYCKGSIMQKNKSIRTFKQSACHHVIMLSSIECASGLSLTEASAVICMDVHNGTPENILDIERQAISRCWRIGQQRDVKIIRLVTQGTVEQQIYDAHYRSLTYS